VLFVWQAAWFPSLDHRRGLTLGLLIGLAYLTNYPGVVLLVSFGTLLLPRLIGRSGAGDRSPLGVALVPLAVAAILVLPWLIFNLLTFGNPVWSQPLERQLGGGDKLVEVVISDGEVVKRNLPSSDPLVSRVRSTAQNLYGNVGFLVRQSFALAPFLGGFVLAGLIILTLRAARGQAGSALPLLLVTLAHGALILLWPTTKFRYLVPLFPLAALIGSWLLWQIKPTELRNTLAVVALGLSCFTSAWTFASIPSHTYYYDGGVVEDNFGGQGEIAYIDDLRRLERVAAAIGAAGPGTVLGPHPLYALARQPLVVNSAAFSEAVVEHLVQRYNVRFIVGEPTQLDFYRDFLPGRVLWQDGYYVVYEVGGMVRPSPPTTYMTIPPSTFRIWPVMKEAWSEAR
jgi:hypothetical protein